MNIRRKLVCRGGSGLVVALLLSVVAMAKTTPSTKPAGIRIDNFGKINDNYYRGAQPVDGDYAALATLGVKTVIDLTGGSDAQAEEQRLVESAGMKFHRIPLTTSDRPPEVAVSEFLKIVTDPANGPVYVHCQGGRHRTGVMTAVYRMTQDGWNADHAYSEMKEYRFEGFPGHPVLKRFVYDFYSALDHVPAAAGIAPLAKTVAASSK